MSKNISKNKNRRMSKKMRNVSKKVMVAAMASSMMLSPVAGVNAFAASTSISATDDAVSILESQGNLETASVEWKAVEGATGYNVYYKSVDASDSAYRQLDNELIRQYPSYFRADAVGLAAGNYIMKVVPVMNNAEESSKAAVTTTVSVKANVREGFAFSKNSTMKTGSGGYNDDGTVPADATILYVTKDTVNTVTADVVTNSKGTKTTCTGLANILEARKKAYDKSHLIIRLVGEIKGSDIDGLNGKGYLELKGCYNVTLEGVGEDATVNGWGILVRDARNVEIRNIGIMLFPDDGISLDTNNENIWVHNNDIFYGTAGSDKDQAKGDGSSDVKGYSTNVTVSYNHFWDSGKCSLCGMSDTKEFFVSYHHNWFDHSDSRHPRIRVGSIHIYNNYFDGNSKYGVGVTKGSSAFVESNVFRNCKYPMISSLQGSDIAGGNQPTLSSEDGGMIKAYNNDITGAKDVIYAQQDGTQFDAYLASSREEQVPATYKTLVGGTTYNNFDTASIMYDYNPTPVEDVAENVKTYAGRVNGGDFTWNFTESDDTSYAVNTELMAKIRAYESDVVSIGGNSVVETPNVPTESDQPDVSETPVESEEPVTPVEPDTSVDSDITNESENLDTSIVTEGVTHNFTTDGTNSSYFKITGNLSDSKGTVSYNGLTLTQCLKMESDTNISFTTTSASKLTLVFSSDFSKKVVVDGTKYKASNGILTVDLAAGSHTISKGDTTNLYYIALSTDGNVSGGTDNSETPDISEIPDVSETPEVPVGSLESTGMYSSLANVEDSQIANAVYVSPNGAASNDGSVNSPLDLRSALDKVANGEASAVLLQSGTYSFDHVITINASGTANAYNVLKACKGAEVVLDFSAETYNTKDTSVNERGIQLNGSYWYIQGITIKGAADNGIMVSGSHNVIERCIFDGNRDTGLQISRRSSSVTDYKDWPSYNYILNCTSKNNCDPATYENADGFASKLTCGDGNVFDGCISYNNSDDGWDLFAKSATGPIGVVTIKNCIAMRNGMTEDGTTMSSCDGNGFKLGGSGVGTPHKIINCLAVENLHHGFTDNNNPSALQVVNCTAFDNNKGGGKNNFSLYRCKDAKASNCISYTTNNTSDKYVNLTGDHLVLTNSGKWYKVTDAQAMDTGSPASRGEVISSGVAASDFVSAKVAAVGTDFDKLWRNADGTINTKGVAMVSGSSAYANFASDGEALGARFSADNKVSKLDVKIALNEGSIETPDTPDVPVNPDETDVPDTPDVPETPDTPVESNASVSATVSTVNNGQSISQVYTIKCNEGTIDLSKLKLVYKAENFPVATQSIWIDNASMKLTVDPWYVVFTEAVKGEVTSDGIVLTITADKQLTAGTGDAQIGLRFAKSDWSVYDQLGAETVEVYYDGQLVK